MPVVAIKAGRSQAGARTTLVSHQLALRRRCSDRCLSAPLRRGPGRQPGRPSRDPEAALRAWSAPGRPHRLAQLLGWRRRHGCGPGSASRARAAARTGGGARGAHRGAGRAGRGREPARLSHLHLGQCRRHAAVLRRRGRCRLRCDAAGPRLSAPRGERRSTPGISRADAFIGAVQDVGARGIVVSSLPESLPRAAAERIAAARLAPMQGLPECLRAVAAASWLGKAWQPDRRTTATTAAS